MTDTKAPDRLRIMQIIAGAIIGGAAIFLTVAIVLRGEDAFGAPAESPVITYVLIGIGAFLVLASQVAPGILTGSGRNKLLQSSEGTGDGPLLALYQTQMIVGLSLAEAGTFLVVIAYLVEGQPVSLIAALLFMGFLMAQYPTRRGVDAWLAEQSEHLQRGE
jgi:hypothetical protein